MRRVLPWLLFLAVLILVMPADTQPAPAKPAPAWVVAKYDSPAPGNVFYNTETVILTLTVKSKAKAPLALAGGTWRIKELGDAWPYPWGTNIRFKESDVVRAEGKIPAATAEQIAIPITWKPTLLGAFGVYLALEDGSGAAEQMAWGFTVVYPPAAGRKLDSQVVFNLYGDYIVNYGPAFKRLGAKWIRWETSWSANEPKPGQWDWKATDKGANAARANDLYIMAIMAHAPNWAVPTLGNGKKYVTYGNGKWETNVAAPYLPQWQEWTRRYVERYKDIVRAGIMLNEPWEGGSISGWRGTGQHYRNMLRAFFGGAHAADRTFTVLGNDSGMNVEDNILCEPGAVDYLDACSIHTFRSYLAPNVAQFGAYGKPVWETESWNGVGEAENVYQVVHELGQGFVKTQPCSIEDIVINSGTPQAAYIAPTGQALSILLHFIEDTACVGEVRPEAAPWMYLFRGRADGPTPAKHVAVIWGRDCKWGNAPWMQVRQDGTLTVNDPANDLTAYDIKGNPLPRAGKAVVIPLTTTPYYLTDKKGADDLAKRLREATIQGLEPVQVALADFTQPLDARPPLRVRVTNVTNVPLAGTVAVTAPEGWTLAEAVKPLKALAPGTTQELTFAVTTAKAVAANRYPVTVTVTTDRGKVTWREALAVTVFAKGTPPLDGTAEAWQQLGAVPVYLTGAKTPVDSFLQYAFPFLNLKEQDNTGYFAQFMGMWDEHNFYVFADINDPSERLRPSMVKGTSFLLHEAPNDSEHWMRSAFPACEGDMVQVAFNVLPYGEKQIANFPPEAQQRVPAKWRIPPADYEYALYLGRTNTLVEGDYKQAVEELLQTDAKTMFGVMRQPKFTEGAPVPEVWRLMAPGTPRHNYFPTSPRAARDQGAVTDAKLVVTREGNVWHYRAALPWSELALVKAFAEQGQPVKFTFLCKNDGGTALDWAKERSVALLAQELLHPTWEENWSPETEWGFIGK